MCKHCHKHNPHLHPYHPDNVEKHFINPGGASRLIGATTLPHHLIKLKK
jgi:hypothetical protein